MFPQTLHSICRIAEVLLTLQQVGNVKYTGWLLQVPCSADRGVIHQLQAQAKLMEDELYRWKETVRSKRASFYELNYFTTLQLLNLRREFGRLRNSSGSAVIAPQMLTLLQSISAHVTPSVVSDVLSKVVQPKLRAQVTTASQDKSGPPDVAMSSSQTPDPALVSQASVSKPVPSQPEQGLSAKQKEVMVNICSRLDCSKQLVLKAFEQCTGDKCDQYDYEGWCVENMEKYVFLDENGDEEDEEESQSDTELQADQQEFKYSQGTYIIVVPTCDC